MVGVRKNDSPAMRMPVARCESPERRSNLHEIDRVDKDEDEQERCKDSAREAFGEIERERSADHAGLLTARGARAATRRRKISASAPRQAATGTSQTNMAADGLATERVVAAIPNIRRPKNARIAPAIAMPRPCRVVRASPSAAKAISPATKA